MMETNDGVNQTINEIGEIVKNLQKLLFQIDYFGLVELPNGHRYEITEDDTSFHPFRAVKRVNPDIAGIERAQLYISKGSPAELLLEFLADFERLFIEAQREKIKKLLLYEVLEDRGQKRLYDNIHIRAQKSWKKFTEKGYAESLIQQVCEQEGFVPEQRQPESDIEAGTNGSVSEKPQTTAKKPAAKVAGKEGAKKGTRRKKVS